ncbi:MAG TPA: SRPBCC family protein [Elusimicrobiota bacterium]|nr:SRPBCC family protein [Elusimicrobiota bacterium]
MSGKVFRLALAGACFLVCAAAPRPGGVCLSVVQERHGNYRLEGAFQVQSTPQVVWSVLTDYAGIPHFVSGLQSSRIVSRDGGRVRLEQTSSAKFLFLARAFTVHLDVREHPPEKIDFADVSGKDFEVYEGSWFLEEKKGQLVVFYRLWAKPRFSVPAFLKGWFFKRDVTRMLEEVKSEILRRD